MAENEPVVIVDDLYVDYKVYAAGNRVGNDGGGILQTRVGRKGIHTVHALRGVSFVAHKSESIGIIGVNGSGKSTLMRALAGFLSPTSGTVYAASQPSLLGVGAALMPQLSGAWNVVLGCLSNGLTREQTNQEFAKIVDFSELGEFIDLPMRTYSSGMSARLRFSIAAARNQDILIVDEALAVGDQDFRVKSETRIREIREAAGTVFLVSHSMGSIRGTCPRTIWINDGLVAMDGPTAEVIKAYEASKKPNAKPPSSPSRPATPRPAAPKPKPAAPKPPVLTPPPPPPPPLPEEQTSAPVTPPPSPAHEPAEVPAPNLTVPSSAPMAPPAPTPFARRLSEEPIRRSDPALAGDDSTVTPRRAVG